MLKRKNLPQNSPLPAPGSDLGRGSKARDLVRYSANRANESTWPRKRLVLIRGRVVSTLKVVCHGNYDPRLKWRTYFQRACLRRCPKSPQQRRFPHNPLPRFLLRPRRGFAYENNWTCHRGRTEFVENSSWGAWLSLFSRRALPFRYLHLFQIPYGEQSSSSHYAYAKRSRVGLSTCATCAPLARPNFNVNTQGVAVPWCATSRGSFQHSTIEPASIRTEEQSAVGFASKLERSNARHFFGPSKRFRCRNQRGPA